MATDITDIKSKKVSELTEALTPDFGNKLYFLATDANNSNPSYFRSLRVSYGQISSLIANNYDSHIIVSCENISNALTVDINSISTTLTDDITTNRHEITSINLLLHDTSDMLSIEIRDLSANLSSDVNRISTNISNDIENLSIALSNDIKLSVEQTCLDYTTVIRNVSALTKTDITSDICAVSTYIVDNINTITPRATGTEFGLVKYRENDETTHRFGLTADAEGHAYVYVPNGGGGGGGGSEPADYNQVRSNVETLSSNLKFIYLDNDDEPLPRNLVLTNTDLIEDVSASVNTLCSYLSDIYLYEDPESHEIIILDLNKIEEHDNRLNDVEDTCAIFEKPFKESDSSTVDILKDLLERISDIPSFDTVFDSIYPIGSIYLSYNENLPASFTGHGTWVRLATGKCLWSSNADGTDVATILNAGIPKPTVQLKNVACSDSTTEITASTTANSITTSKLNLSTGDEEVSVVQNVNDSEVSITDNGHTHDMTAEIEFIDDSGVYGESETVQPPAIVVSMWRRES